MQTSALWLPFLFYGIFSDGMGQLGISALLHFIEWNIVKTPHNFANTVFS